MPATVKCFKMHPLAWFVNLSDDLLLCASCRLETGIHLHANLGNLEKFANLRKAIFCTPKLRRT